MLNQPSIQRIRSRRALARVCQRRWLANSRFRVPKNDSAAALSIVSGIFASTVAHSRSRCLLFDRLTELDVSQEPVRYRDVATNLGPKGQRADRLGRVRPPAHSRAATSGPLMEYALTGTRRSRAYAHRSDCVVRVRSGAPTGCSGAASMVRAPNVWQGSGSTLSALVAGRGDSASSYEPQRCRAKAARWCA